MRTRSETRTVEMEIEIDAPPEAVWKALTDPDELVRWFPIEARVDPGEGGNIFLGWGAGMEGNCRIERWQPNQRLTTGWVEGFGEGAAALDREPLVVDYRLDGRGGSTVLRLVHSGFGAGEKWDEEYHGVSRGWQFELRSLRHYLERHAGRRRRVAWARKRIELAPAAVWARLWSRDGLLREGRAPGAEEGQPFAFTMATDDRIEGHVLVHPAGREFGGTVSNMDDAIFRTGYEYCGNQWEAMLWLSSWSASDEQV
ncbi:MAG TPA: SRPBCC domain-containing protein, partial [Candidatus Polarisedimenticolaceae bacterium]|nr:SRPBCC domain-containing protein [Candidatus Polarisedimenticolaceae bacterium]